MTDTAITDEPTAKRPGRPRKHALTGNPEVDAAAARARARKRKANSRWQAENRAFRHPEQASEHELLHAYARVLALVNKANQDPAGHAVNCRKLTAMALVLLRHAEARVANNVTVTPQEDWPRSGPTQAA